MAHPSRRVPSPNPSRYYAVPQSPQHPNHPYGQHRVQHQQQQRRPSRSNRAQPAPVNERPAVAAMPPRNDLAQGVATGAIGAGYGPYSVRPSSSTTNLVIRLKHIATQASPRCSGWQSSL